jgi:hypothetical protein
MSPTTGLCLVLLCFAYAGEVHPAYAKSVVKALYRSIASAMNRNSYPRIVDKEWVPFSHVTVSVRFYGWEMTQTLYATRKGTFAVGVQSVHWCQNLTVVAGDTAGHHVVLHGTIPISSCTPPGSGTHLVLHVLTPK